MSHLASGILGTVAATFALGAVHLEIASGHDLLGPSAPTDARLQSTAPDGWIDAASAVNRSSKSDRGISLPSADGVTISFKIQGVADTSVLMRVPVGDMAQLQRGVPAAKDAPESDARKVRSPRRMVACEPSMSVLAVGAKQFDSGRCLT